MKVTFEMLDLDESCSFRFYQRYVLNQGQDDIEETLPLLINKGVQKGIEAIVLDDVNLDRAANIAWVETGFSPDVKKDELTKLIGAAPVYHNIGIPNIYFEMPLASHADAPLLQGYIHLLVERDHAFIDWKTTWHPFSIQKNNRMALIAWVILQETGWANVVGSHYFLRFGRNQNDSHQFTQQEAEATRQWAYDLAMKIQRRIELAKELPAKVKELFPYKPGKRCHDCPFALTCYKTFGVNTEILEVS